VTYAYAGPTPMNSFDLSDSHKILVILIHKIMWISTTQNLYVQPK
jgi:hypothetical protein